MDPASKMEICDWCSCGAMVQEAITEQNPHPQKTPKRIDMISNTRTVSLADRIKAIIKMPSEKRTGYIRRSQSKEVY